MAEEKQRVEAEEHIRALAKIWKPKLVATGVRSRPEEVKPE